MIWQVGVKAYGIPKRCRKSQWVEHEAVEEVTVPDPAIAEIIALDWIEKNMKTVDLAFSTLSLNGRTLNYQVNLQ